MNLYKVVIQHSEYSQDTETKFIACESVSDIEDVVGERFGHDYVVKNVEEIGNESNFAFKQ
jgi:hypothetical protein